ncbi:MAG: M14 family zinc carboxypeptidase [Candidatus Paceibacterota bacterium]|jgi:hypothetical protein
MKNFVITILVIIVAGFGIYLLFQNSSKKVDLAQDQMATTTGTGGDQTGATQKDKSKTIIGVSVEKRDIIAYHYGGVSTTTTELIFVGDIHGGYSWNTALVAYELMDYLKANPDVIPANVRVTVIPVLNPDGLYKVIGTTSPFTSADVSSSQDTVIAGRFNANEVDLNRNFDCDWQTSGTWQSKTVSGGSKIFSEPESLALKNYVETNKPTSVVVWYSAAGGVYASNCHNGVSKETETLMKTYADASGYPAHASFDFYATTGDLTNWLAKINIPAISILLTNHTDTEWTKNKAGINALLKYYAN